MQREIQSTPNLSIRGASVEDLHLSEQTTEDGRAQVSGVVLGKLKVMLVQLLFHQLQLCTDATVLEKGRVAAHQVCNVLMGRHEECSSVR